MGEDRCCQPPGAQYYPTLFLYPQQEQLNLGLDKPNKLRLYPDSGLSVGWNLWKIIPSLETIHSLLLAYRPLAKVGRASLNESDSLVAEQRTLEL